MKSLTETNDARRKYNAAHPEKPRDPLTITTPHQRAKIEEYTYVATAVAKLYASKGLDFDELRSTAHEAIVRCAIKMDRRPYSYVLVYRCCRDACIDLMRQVYKDRERKRPRARDGTAAQQEHRTELTAQEDALLADLLADAPADYREIIIDCLHLTREEILAKYDMSDRTFRRMRAEIREWVGGYLFG